MHHHDDNSVHRNYGSDRKPGWLHRRCQVAQGQRWTDDPLLGSEMLNAFEQGALHLCFSLDLANYIAGPAQSSAHVQVITEKVGGGSCLEIMF